jgi:translation initiation factor IF-2
MTLAGGARLEDIFAMVQRGETATLGLVLKADVHGSLEALTDALRKLDQAHDEVRLSFVHRAVGGITESDINLAAVANATVIGFNVRPDRQACALTEQWTCAAHLRGARDATRHSLENARSSTKRSSPATEVRIFSVPRRQAGA